MNNFETGVAVGYLLTKKKSSNLGQITITENGTYNASDDDLDGYSKVIANVDPTGEIEELEQQLEEAEAALEELLQCQQRVIGKLEEVTGITATNCDELMEVMEEAIKEGEEPEGGDETPSEEDQGKTEPEDPTSQSEIDVIAETINNNNGQPSVTDTPQDGGGNPNNIKSYFAIKGLGWYSLRIDKNNKFEPTCMWYSYAMCFNTTIRVIVTKFDEHGDEKIVYSNTLDTHSNGNYNWPYDPDYIGDQGTPPGKTKGWNGNDDSPKIQFYRNGNALHIAVYRWSISGGGGMSGQWYETTITLT